MPSARAPLRARRVVRSGLHRFARIAGTAIVAGFALFALLLLGVRFVVFPRIEAYRDTLIATLARSSASRSRSTR